MRRSTKALRPRRGHPGLPQERKDEAGHSPAIPRRPHESRHQDRLAVIPGTTDLSSPLPHPSLTVPSHCAVTAEPRWRWKSIAAPDPPERRTGSCPKKAWRISPPVVLSRHTLRHDQRLSSFMFCGNDGAARLGKDGRRLLQTLSKNNRPVQHRRGERGRGFYEQHTPAIYAPLSICFTQRTVAC
jgi:hypothetical protein